RRCAASRGAACEAGVGGGLAIVNERGVGWVCGVMAGDSRVPAAIRAAVTIAADGRRSAIAFGLGVARHPPTPRRWAIGAYFEGAGGTTTFGEMHVRRGRYIGVASVPGGLTNVCLVRPSGGGDDQLRDPAGLLTATLARDPMPA